MQCATMEQLQSGAYLWRWAGRLPSLQEPGIPPSASCPHTAAVAAWEVLAAPEAAWKSAACVPLLSGTEGLCHGHFTSTVVLHGNSLGLLKPHGKCQPCKLGQEQLES